MLGVKGERNFHRRDAEDAQKNFSLIFCFGLPDEVFISELFRILCAWDGRV
jgi:hypothetical protein